MRKITLLFGIGVGYVLGAAAGRDRYEQIKTTAAKAWGNPKVQETVGTAQRTAVQSVKEKLPESATSAVGGAKGSGSGSPSPSPSSSGTSPAGTSSSSPSTSAPSTGSTTPTVPPVTPATVPVTPKAPGGPAATGPASTSPASSGTTAPRPTPKP